MIKTVVWLIEAAFAYLFYGLFAALPVDVGSALCGWACRLIGPRLPLSAVARDNLAKAFPHMPRDRMEAIVAQVWENVGRVAAEFPHIHWLINNRVDVVNVEHCRALRDDGKPGIFISAHYGNWELAGAQGCHEGIPMILVYRAANNPYVERLYKKGRAASATGGQIAKGQQGARQVVDVLRKGGHLGMLVDQKMNDGLAVPFFGRDAMTAPAVARMSIKFRCPVVPAKVERIKGARFRITFYPPLELPESGDTQADTMTLMTRINDLVESWIRDDPGQWLWLHRRWPKPNDRGPKPKDRGPEAHSSE